MKRIGWLGLILLWLGAAMQVFASDADVMVPSPEQLDATKVASNDFRVLGRVGNILRVEATVGYDAGLSGGTPNSQARQRIAQAVIAELGDHYDFIVVAPTMQIDLGAFKGLHWQVHNDVQGIGRPPMDFRAQFGSNARLKAVIDLDESILPVSFTDPEYDFLLDTLMHEVMHQWAAYVPFLVDGAAASPLSTPSRHWSSRYDSAASVMFGARWQSVEGGRWRQVKVRDGYGPLDLYLAGFIPAAELSTTRFLRTTELQGEELPEIGRTVDADERPLTAQELLQALGPRVPAHPQSQRAFTAALVALEPAGHPATEADTDRLEILRSQAEKRFAAVTGSRAELRVGIQDASLRPLPGTPAGVGSSAAPAAALDLAAATQFLIARMQGDLWQDKASTQIPDSVRVLIALAGDPAQASVLAPSRMRLDAREARTLEHLAAMLRVPGLASARRDLLLQQLLAMQSEDGGFGLASGQESAALDTALALQAMIHVRSTSPSVVPIASLERTAARLRALRNSALNCWGTEQGPCELLATASAVTALGMLGGESNADGLFRWRLASGGFGSGQGATPFETALALNALSGAGLSSDIRVREGQAWLAAQQRADGSFAGSVAATAEALLFFRRDARADLRFEGSLQAQPEQAVQGQSIHLRFDVRNAGSQAAPASALVVDVQPVAGGAWQPLSGLDQSPALAANARTTLSLVWETASFAAGEYRLRVRLDTNTQLDELDESNNALERTFTLASPPTAPDLAVVDGRIELVPNVVTSLPQAVAVRFAVENLGLGAAAGVSIRIHGWRFGELLPLRTFTRNFAAQARSSIDESIELTDPDITRIVVVVDPEQAVAEAREDNNRAEVVIARTATIDLAALPGDISLPADIRSGTPMEIGLTLRNLGTSDSPVTRLHVEIRRADNSTLRIADQEVQIPAGGTTQRQIPWVPDFAGAGALRVRIDALAQVVEVSEGNNEAELPFQVLASTAPNLKVAAAGWQVTPEPALEGAAVELALTVINDSAHPSPAFSVEFASARPGSPDYSTLGTARVANGLAAGASQRIAIQTEPLLGPTPRQLLARIDSASDVPESNENDNLSLRLLQVKSRPNLQLAAMDTTVIPAQSAPGVLVRISAILRNTGEQAVPTAALELHRLAADGSPAAVLAAPQQIANLQPGEARSVEFQFSRPAGEVRIELAADRANALAEGREDDNRVVLDLDGVDPDFYVTEPFFSPNGDGRADQTEIVARLSPPTAARLRVLSSWGEEVLRYGDGAVVSQLGGIWDGRRADGRRALDDTYEVRLESADGRTLKRLSLVLDTNRRPLVLAARDGKARVQSLHCEFPDFDNSPAINTSLHGLDFYVARGGQSTATAGLYRFDFQGGMRPLMLIQSAVPGAFLSDLVGMLDEHTVAAVAGTSQGLKLLSVDADTGQFVLPPTIIGHGASKYVGKLFDGSLIFKTHSGGLVGWTEGGPDALWHPGISAEPMSFGTNRVLMVSGTGVLTLVGAGGSIEVAEPLPYTDYRVPDVTHFAYSRVARAFFWAASEQTVWEGGQLQKILRIDEMTGAVTELASSSLTLANLTVATSPSGRYLVTAHGADARATIHDLTGNSQVQVDLSAVVPVDVPLRFPEVPFGQGLFRLYWSPDESHFAARFEAYQDDQPVAIEKAWYEHATLAAHGFVVEVSSGQLRDLGDFKPTGWVEGELQLLGEQDGIALERGGERWPLLPAETGFEISEHFPYRSSGISAVVATSLTGNCPRQPQKAIFSRANGFAKLETEYLEALRTLVIRGSADDQHFGSYTLEFRPQAAGAWTEILSGFNMVDEQVFGAWTPPSPGTFQLRLRVRDRAGNQVEAIRDVVWFGSGEALGWVQSDTRFISPNGDGIQDSLTVSYELRAAAELEVRVVSAEDNLVRSQRIVHSSAGSYSWQWNGRHQDGSVLPDGEYRVIFSGRAYTVWIDTALPTLDVAENEPGTSACLPSGLFRPDGGTVRVLSSDANFGRISLQSRLRDGSAPWAEREHYRSQHSTASFEINFRPGELRDQDFRMIADDLAGNRRIVPFQVSTLSVVSAWLETGTEKGAVRRASGLGWRVALAYPSRSPPDRLVLGVSSRGLEGWRVEYRGDGAWQVLPHTVLAANQLGDLERTCFWGEEAWLGVDLPALGIMTEVRLRHSTPTGIPDSNIVVINQQGHCEENPRDPCCLPEPPAGCDVDGDSSTPPGNRSVCEAVGVNEAALPFAVPLPTLPQIVAARWVDPRGGNTIQLPLLARPAGQLAAVGITSLPIGEHVVRVEYANGVTSSTTVGRRTAVPSLPVVEYPPPNGRLCGGVPHAVRGHSDDLFTEVVESEWGESVRLPPLPRPDGLPGLSHAAPADWELGGPDSGGQSEGPATLRVRSDFCDAHSGWVERPVFLDLFVGLEAMRIGPSLDALGPPTRLRDTGLVASHRFAPSLGSKAWIASRSYEDVEAHARVYAVGSRPQLGDHGYQGIWSPTGPALVDLGSRGPVTGPIHWEWDGRNAQGQVLNGDYVVVIVSRDDCGHERTDSVPVIVDNTPPQLQWLQPASDSAVALFQSLRVRVQDQLVLQTRFSYALAGGSHWVDGEWEPVYKPGTWDYVRSWESRVSTGTYRLRVAARDHAGLEGYADIEIRVPERLPLTTGADLNRDLMSPNGDGVLEDVSLGLGLSRPAQVSLRVLDGNNVVRRTLANASALSGQQSLVWNGRDDAGVVVPDGDYRMALRVVDPDQPAHFEEAEFPVAVDNAPPELRMLAPVDAFSNGRGALTLEVVEAHPLGVQASASPAVPGLLAQHSGGGVLELAQLDGVAEGSYTLALVAQDRAGNRSQLNHAFTLDRTAPRVSVTAPTEDAVLTRVRGAIPVQGQIEDSHLQGRKLELRSGDTLVATLATDSSSTAGSWNLSWDGMHADGDYRLRMSAIDRAGNTGEVDVPVVLDNTPPEARIDLPAQGAAVGASFAISGRATDANFDRFEIDFAAPAATPAFQRLAEGTQAVADGLLATVLSPSDGPYILRLRAFDRAGLVSEAFREVRVDSQPPPAPTQLRVDRQGTRNARLTWVAPVPATDVTRYRLLRDNQLIAEPSGLQYLDTELSEGVHRWQVHALDAAGNESTPSNVVSLAVDTTPPDVAIYAPTGGSRRGGIVPVLGKAFSRDDFQRWELRASRAGQPPVLLASGTSAVLNSELAQWNTQGFDGSVRLRLEASDILGNTAAREIELVIDNQPPAAPVGLVVSESGSEDVRLNWTPNTESDLHGYLVYRGARLLNGEPGTSPLLLAIPDATWLDEGVGDGNFQWRVQAVDTTGNLSAFSDPASLARNGRPPRVQLIRPQEGERFDTRIAVRGQSADLDLAEVRFESRALGANDWSPFGPLFTAPPFDSLFEPPQAAYGFYELRARSLDQEGLSDPAPPVVRVEHRDLQAPPTPAGLFVLVDGDQATLQWEAVDAADLAHYEVQRAASSGDFSTIATVPAPGNGHVDAGLSDGEYRYRIRAVDASGNRSPGSAPVNARVFSLEFEQPYTPTLETAVNWTLRSPVSGQLEASRQSPAGSTAIPEQSISAANWLTFPSALDLGLNTLTVRVRDGAGNRSRAGHVRVLRSERPPAPTSLLATANGHQVTLGWQMASHAYPVAFRVFRNGDPRQADTLLSPQAAQLMPAQGSPRNLPLIRDGLSYTGETFTLGSQGLPIQVQLAQPAIVVALELEMDAPQSGITAVIDGEWMGAWVRLPSTFAEESGRLIASPGQAYRSTQFRIHLSGPAQSLYLRELKLRVRPTQATNNLVETVVDGRYRYRVTAVNEHAFESAFSEAADIDVGDIQAPPPVVLSGQAVGVDAQLQWTESTAPDLASYRVLRGSTEIATITNLSQRSHVDAGLPNGAYGYRVLAVDQAGNVAPSNQLVLTIDIGSLPAPTGLTVEAMPGGGALRLRWQPGAGSSPQGYSVYRSLAQGGPFESIADTDSTPLFDDTGLVNGTRYYYRVRAYDVIGNTSPDSAIASGVPVFADAPVITPVFHYPTRYGRSVVIPRTASVIAGRGQPGSSVRIGTGAGAPRQAEVAVEPQVRSFLTGSEALVSPDARHVYSDGWLRMLEGEEPGVFLGSDCAPMQWLDAHRLLRCHDAPASDILEIYHLSSATRQTLLDVPGLRLFRLSGDGRRLLVGADLPGGESGLELAWRDQQPVGEWNRVAGVSVDDIVPTSVRIHADGRWAVWYHDDGRVQVLDMHTGQLRLLPVQAQGAPALANRAPEALLVAASGAPGIHQVNLASGAVAVAEFAVSQAIAVEFNHDDTRVALLSPDAWTLFRWPDRVEVTSRPVSSASALTALGTEEWAINADIEVMIVQPAGVFRLPELELAYGDNVVAALAVAPGQLDSGPALPITLTVPGDGLPDLAIRPQDLSVLPNVGSPGASVRIGARVRNSGSGASPATSATLQLSTPSGQQLPAQTVPVPPVAAGAEVIVGWQSPALGDSGVYGIAVEANATRTFAESSFSNNRASRTLTVNADGQPELSLNVDRAIVAPAEVLHGGVSVVAGGSAFNGRVQLRILDDQGHLVVLLHDRLVQLQTPTSTLSLPFDWTPGVVAAGRYQVLAELRDAAGQLLRSRNAFVDVRAEALISLALDPGQQSVTVGTQIQLQGRLRFVQGNVPIEAAELRSRLVAQSGLTVAEQTRSLGSFVVGHEASYPVNFATGTLAAGSYSVISELWSGSLLAEAGAAVQLQNVGGAAAVAGTWQVADTALPAGTVANLQFEVRNTGAQALADLPVRARARRQATGVEVANVSHSWTLAPGESRVGSLSIPASAMTISAFMLTLEIPSGPLARMLDVRSVLVADVEPPVLAPVRPVAGSIVRGRFEVQVRVLDAHSSVAQAELRVGSGAYQAMSPGTSFPGEFRVNLDLPEGPQTLQARARDAFGNLGNSAPWSVTVDRTPPQIDIQGVTEGGVYALPATPVVQVTDTHLDTTTVLLDGQAYVSGTPVVADGEHRLFVSAIDRAGNRSQRSLRFVIDTSPPVIEFTFPAEAAVLSSPTTAVLLATEPAANVTLTVGAFSAQAAADASGVASFAAVPISEGPNQLRAVAVDNAGNASQPVNRTVHRSSATVGLFSGQVQPSQPSGQPGPDLLGTAVIAYQGSVAVDAIPARLSLVEQASGQTSAQLQWTRSYAAGASVPQPYQFASGALSLGAYLLILEAQLTDTGGQRVWTVLDQEPITLADLSPPNIVLTHPAAGQLLPANFAVGATVTDAFSPIGAVELLLDTATPQAMAPAPAPSYAAQMADVADGDHGIRVRARDEVGHERTEPVQPRMVQVDGTPPVISIAGISDGQLSNQPLTATIAVTDAHPQNAEILLDGAPYISGTAISSEGPHTLRVIATDAVANQAARELRFTIDRTPPALEIQQPTANSATPLSHVPVVAATEAGIEVELLDQSVPLTAISDSQGVARFPTVWLAPGENNLRVQARDRAGNASTIRSVRVTRLTSNTAPIEAAMQHPASVVHGQVFAGTLTVTATIPNSPFGDELRLDIRGPSQALVSRLEWSRPLLQGQSVELPFSQPTSTWPAARLQLQLSWRRLSQPDAPFALIAATQVDILDVEAPSLVLLSPSPGASVPHPIPVRVQASDTLSGVEAVAARLDDGPWVELTRVAASDEWEGQVPAPALGLRQLSFRAADRAGNARSLGPVAVCRDQAAEWPGFANGFESPRASSKSGFEAQSCAQAAKALQGVYDWWRWMGAQPATRESGQ